eukprot:g18711.t1
MVDITGTSLHRAAQGTTFRAETWQEEKHPNESKISSPPSMIIGPNQVELPDSRLPPPMLLSDAQLPGRASHRTGKFIVSHEEENGKTKEKTEKRDPFMRSSLDDLHTVPLCALYVSDISKPPF